MLVSGDYPSLSSTLLQAFPIITTCLQQCPPFGPVLLLYAEVALPHRQASEKLIRNPYAGSKEGAPASGRHRQSRKSHREHVADAVGIVIE